MYNLAQFDVVKVPFPFTELPFMKRRLSSKHKPWPLDTQLTSLKEAGLTQDSLIWLKIFTLDESLVLAKIGSLSRKDIATLSANLTKLFALKKNA